MKLPWMMSPTSLGVGNRDTDAETFDGEAADDALRRVEHEACGTSVWLQSRIKRTCALRRSVGRGGDLAWY